MTGWLLRHSNTAFLFSSAGAVEGVILLWSSNSWLKRRGKRGGSVNASRNKKTELKLKTRTETFQIRKKVHKMRHASADNEPVKNSSLTVSALLKICTHCEQLSKKVREKKNAGRVENFCPVFVAQVEIVTQVVFH